MIRRGGVDVARAFHVELEVEVLPPEKTFRVLKALPCDIFLGAHGAYLAMEKKYAKFNAGDATAFVDPEGYKAYVAEREQAFLMALAKRMRN